MPASASAFLAGTEALANEIRNTVQQEIWVSPTQPEGLGSILAKPSRVRSCFGSVLAEPSLAWTRPGAVLAKPSSPACAAPAERQRALRARERKRVAVPTGVEPVFQD